MLYIKNAKVVLENGIIFDGVIGVENDYIAKVSDASEVEFLENDEIIDAKGAYVGPGFVDIHVHGGGKYMFDSEPLKAAEHFLSHGETTVLATLYYNLNKEEFLNSIQLVKEAMKNKKFGSVIGGFYIEGPYMNPKFGASPELNRWKGEIIAEDYIPLVDEAGEDVKVWAVAPERKGIEPFMKYAKLKNFDVTFAVGHSEATPSEIEKIKRYGLRLMTHCMDATGRVTRWSGTRGSGPDEACLLDNDMYAELICDSLAIHVNPELQRLVLKNKGIDKVVLITDSFVSESNSPAEYSHITDLSFDANGNLCGSRLTMDVVCRNFMKHTNCGIAQAFLAASRNPAKAIGMYDEIGSIAVGKRANLVFVDDMFNIQKVMLDGVITVEKD